MRSFATFVIAVLTASPLSAQTIKICEPQRGIWETAPPDMGKVAGIFKKHGVDLDGDGRFEPIAAGSVPQAAAVARSR